MGNATGCIKPRSDPDSAWKMQHTLMKEKEMYNYVDLNMGGELIVPRPKTRTSAAAGPSRAGSVDTRSTVSASDIGIAGPRREMSELVDVRTIARDELQQFLYREDGAAFTILKSHYQDWLEDMKKLSSELSEQFIDSEYRADAFNTFKLHRACWKLEKRGWMGETPLHLCYILNTPRHIRVANALLDEYPQLALDVYEGREFFGESSLHIAVANGDLESVERLVKCGADIHQRATGRFFRPDDQKDDPDGATDYVGDAYFGEYPLAFAASRGDIKIYDYLIEQGAEPNEEDSFGNTVLHMAVIHNQPMMLHHAVCKAAKPAVLTTLNKRNLTPLTLASKLGRSRMFREILALGSVENWRFGEISCSIFPLATLDSIGPRGGADWQSALCNIVQGESDEHLEMLEDDVVRQLLLEKWTTYAKSMFIVRLVWALVHLMLLSAALYSRPAGDKLLHYDGWKDGLRYTCELLLCLSCLGKLVETVAVICSHGFENFLRNCMHAPSQTIYLVSCVLVLLCVPVRAAGLHVAEDALLMFAAPGAWLFLLFFARAWSRTGPFVVMVYKMSTGDLFRFGVIYSIFLVGFTTGFFFLFRDVNSEDEDVKKYFTVGDILLVLFQMTLGEFKYEVFDSSHYPLLSKLVFFVFMVLMSVLLLQMLIAMMGNTYRKVISRAKKEWRRQWANMVLVLERTSFRTASLRRYREKYSRQLDPSLLSKHPYSTGAVTGLMVINRGKDQEEEEQGGSAERQVVGRTSVWKLKLDSTEMLPRTGKLNLNTATTRLDRTLPIR